MSILLIILAIINLIFLAVILFRLFSQANERERLERIFREEVARSREETASNANTLTNSLMSRMSEVSNMQKNQLDTFSKQLSELTTMNEKKLEAVRSVVETNLRTLQQDNNQKLEKMRETVDEKLHATLEKRLGDSFKLVIEQLERVQHGFGEMQALASGVGDLKKIFTNVKTRGIWGEIQLGNLLEQILTKDQYAQNIVTKKGSRDPVEFAIKLPGRDKDSVYMPIDAKFPKEDYERLLQAQEEGNIAAIEEYSKAIEARIKLEAKTIRDKYIDPPQTTDFAILYLPIEGLFAEVLRRPGLCDVLQRDFRVIIAGPTTIAALLNALQMGFRTLAVEKRASEVWALLGAVKTEFGKFGGILEKTKEKLKQASDNIDDAATKSRTIERKLKNIQELPPGANDYIEKIETDTVQEPFDDSTVLQ